MSMIFAIINQCFHLLMKTSLVAPIIDFELGRAREHCLFLEH